MRFDCQENYQREELITAVSSSMTSKYLNYLFSFYNSHSLYVHGGRELEEGPMSNMWRLSISGIHELMSDPEYGVQWEPIEFKGQGALPGKISHHKPAVFGHTVVIFGGNNEFDNTTDAFEFDTNKNTWHKMK